MALLQTLIPNDRAGSQFSSMDGGRMTRQLSGQGSSAQSEIRKAKLAWLVEFMLQHRDSLVHGVKKLAGAIQTAKSAMLKVNHDEDTRQSRTSLASIFEDLQTFRKSILGKSSQDGSSQRSWIEKTFHKRECSKFIRSSRDPGKCCCGRLESWAGHTVVSVLSDERWHPYRHTESKPTDAYGCIEFQGAPHPSKAQYVRLSSYDTKADQVLQLLQNHWGLDLPKLLITVHGGILNFDLQPKLKRVFRKGLLKAAKTTGAWIITGGTNTGVTRHVGDAISDRTLKAKNKIIAIGIAPWGIVENKDDLIGKDVTVPYHCVSSPKTNYSVLNNNHSYFLLVDNGTVGKYGGEIIFRKRLEKYIAHQKICITSGVKGRGVPVICVVLEGGANTIRSVLEYVTDTPPVPVVVCDGSGRAADLLAFTHKYSLDDGTMPESLRDQLILTIQKTFQYGQEQAEKLFIELMLCVKRRELITVFRMGEGAQDIDLAILTALLKGTNASAPDQLSLALTWDRVDIARSHIFVYGQEWPEGSLEQAMMDALINDRVDFVKLLLENGVHMQSFLTIPRLEELYNTRQGPSNTLRYLVRDVRKHLPHSYRYTLPDIGLVIQHLMGGAFRATYCRRRFRQKYHAIKRTGTSQGNIGNLVTMLPTLVSTKQAEELFPYPFHDLMIWAVLMKRQKMALFMWQHGEEAMAKALMACKLYKAMAHEADADDLEIEIPDEIRKYAKEFQTLALELLEHCYKMDDDYTQQLLTYELKNFSNQTCLSLGVAANHREFIAHTCCQMLLNDMWMGGLRMRKSTSLKVLLGILVPPYILALEFKSKEELQLMPQTMEEHLDELEDSASDNENISVSSFEEEQSDYGDEIESSFNSQTQVNTKENGNLIVDNSLSSNHVYKKKKSPLRLGKKIYEFYNAPITKFWAHTISYAVFLTIYVGVVLSKTPDRPAWQEYYVMAYICTLAVEKFRQIIASEPTRAWMKIKVYLDELWNIWDTIAILLFASGVIVRHLPITPKAARMVYTVNIVFWFIRILEILSVNKYLGPYVKIIGKLIVDMSYFIIILLIVLMSFGVVRQSIHFQEGQLTWGRTIRNMFFYPYWMIYGELFADEIDTCTDPSRDECVYGSWIAPALMCMYLLVANILLVNLLIARFNATFIRNNANSREIWKFQRYQLIINYELRPILPPPIIIISHVYLALKYIGRRCQGKRDNFDNGLKLFLSHDDMEKLHDFEEECAEDYFRDKENKFQSSSEERIRVINERSENLTLRMEDMNQKENTVKMSVQTMDYRISMLEELAVQNTEVLNQIHQLMSQFELRSRHTSERSSSSRARLNSEESLGEQLEYQQGREQYLSTPELGMEGWRSRDNQHSLDSLDKSSTELVATRNTSSPVLVRSRKNSREDSLQKYTDYSKSPVKSGMSRRQLERQASVKHRQSLPKVPESSPELQRSPSGSKPPKSPLLIVHSSRTTFPPKSPRSPYIRSRSESVRSTFPPKSPNTTHARPIVRKDMPQMSPTETSLQTNDEEPQTVSLSEVGENDKGKTLIERRLATPLHIDTNLDIPDEHSENLATSISDLVVCVCDTYNNMDNSNNSSAVYSTARMSTDTTVSTRVPAIIETEDTTNTNRNSDNSDESGPVATPVYDTDSFPVSYSTPFTPLLTITSLQAEYTTITDEIDTTCMINRTPPRSPTSANPLFGDHLWEAEAAENPASKTEKATLRQAEEAEHKKMAKVIRHRLRQISLDENDSISDIAKLVITEMDVTDVHSDHEEEEEEEEMATVLAIQEGKLEVNSEEVSAGASDSTNRTRSLSDGEDHVDSGPITFDAIQIRIRRASSQDTESQ